MTDPASNPLEHYFAHNKGRLLHKWIHYFEIYHRHFQRYRNRGITLLEFGVYHGGSLQMWKNYFGKAARIIGVDISPECKSLEEEQIKVIIGDQEDREFLRKLANDLGPVDIIIDDGGHKMAQQIATFEETFSALRAGGTYLVEDLHTSYWEDFGGKLKGSATFIEYVKDLIDHLHAWHSQDTTTFPVTYYTRNIKALHVYESIVVIEKDSINPPQVRKTGRESF